MCFGNIGHVFICRVENIFLRLLLSNLNIIDVIEEAARVQIITYTMQNICFHRLREHGINWTLTILNLNILICFKSFIIPSSSYSVPSLIFNEMFFGSLGRVLAIVFLLLMNFLFAFLRKYLVTNTCIHILGIFIIFFTYFIVFS